jgi:hypothetical protein
VELIHAPKNCWIWRIWWSNRANMTIWQPNFWSDPGFICIFQIQAPTVGQNASFPDKIIFVGKLIDNGLNLSKNMWKIFWDFLKHISGPLYTGIRLIQLRNMNFYYTRYCLETSEANHQYFVAQHLPLYLLRTVVEERQLTRLLFEFFLTCTGMSIYQIFQSFRFRETMNEHIVVIYGFGQKSTPTFKRIYLANYLRYSNERASIYKLVQFPFKRFTFGQNGLPKNRPSKKVVMTSYHMKIEVLHASDDFFGVKFCFECHFDHSCGFDGHETIHHSKGNWISFDSVIFDFVGSNDSQEISVLKSVHFCFIFWDDFFGKSFRPFLWLAWP